jgi:hypothetical protein
MFCDNPTVMDDGAIAFSESVITDLSIWREPAREVEQLSGAPMAENEEWNARLNRHIDRATAWCARTGMGVHLWEGCGCRSPTQKPSPSHGWPFGVLPAAVSIEVPYRLPVRCRQPAPRLARGSQDRTPTPDDDMLEATRSATPGGSYPAPHPESRRGE